MSTPDTNKKPLVKVVDACLSRRGQFFTLAKLADKTGLPQKKVYWCMNRLVREGHIIRYRRIFENEERVGRPRVANIVYLVLVSLKDRKERVLNFKRKDTAWDRMWRAIRVMRSFKVRDLVATSEAKRNNVKYFLRLLRRAAIVTHDKGPGNPHIVEWRLVEDIGPERPSMEELRKRVQLLKEASDETT